MRKKIDWQKLFLTRWKPYFWIAVVGFLLYARTVLFKFVYLDDNSLILDNFFFIRRLSNIAAAFRNDVFISSSFADAYYRPLLTTSFILDAQLSGQSPVLYHLSNIIYHIIASMLVYKLFKTLKIKKDTSLILALVFVVHPVLTQAVAWIPGRNDSLLTIFFISSFLLNIS